MPDQRPSHHTMHTMRPSLMNQPTPVFEARRTRYTDRGARKGPHLTTGRGSR